MIDRTIMASIVKMTWTRWQTTWNNNLTMCLLIKVKFVLSIYFKFISKSPFVMVPTMWYTYGFTYREIGWKTPFQSPILSIRVGLLEEPFSVQSLRTLKNLKKILLASFCSIQSTNSVGKKETFSPTSWSEVIQTSKRTDSHTQKKR